MNFELTEEQQMLRDTARKWSQNVLGPLAEKADDEDWMPPDMFRKAGEVGMMGIAIDPEYGGSGMDVLSEVIAAEEISAVSPGLGLSLGASSNLCAGNIQRNCNEEQKARYLPKLVSGEWIGCLGLTEPGSGSDALAMRTTAVRDGDDYVLNGSKMFITNGPVADLALIYAKTSPEAGAFGISAFIVETAWEGFSCSRKLKKAGHRGSPTGELRFDNLRVPAENLIGEENMGIAVVMRGLDIERVICAGGCVGIARQAIDHAIKYSLEREQFGKPIAKFQMIQAKLADMYAKYEAAKNMTYKAAVMAEEQTRGGKGTELTLVAASAVMYAAEAATAVASDAVQIHGGYGYCLEFPVQRLWRDAKLFEIGAGTTEVRKMIIARELLRRGHC